MYFSRTFLKLTSPVAGIALLIAGVILLWPHTTSAQYVGNNLIDDNIFLNAASMNQPQIQAFLKNRAGYLANYQLLFDCASTGTASNSAYVSAGAPCGQTVYASTIIYYAAQVYGLNPQVILATLQKEQSLVTDPSPTSHQLNFAMGYGCGDSSGCSQDSGFLHQVDDATWQLRIDSERSRGNNSWWNPQFNYVCPSATRYYSTGLYPGRYVSFYDDYGTAYTSFVINDSATAALYCYTPHAYPGSAREYYSGSYNFVVAFEQWFGSTQPAVEVASPIRVSTVPQGVFTNAPTTASFDLANTTNSAMTVNVAITVRDSSGGNHDFNLKSVTVPAHGTATYSDTQTFSTEDTYSFGLTSNTNGSWNDNYPSSANIDNPRTLSLSIQAMPTVTVAPASNVADMRIGKIANLSFTVKNNSAQAMSVGKITLAIRGPSGQNYDLALVDPGTLAAGATYAYTQSFIPSVAGTYNGFITDTANGGITWNDTNFPAQASGIARTIQFTVKPSPTLTQGPSLSIPSPHVGQAVNVTFKAKNFGDSAVNAGYIAIAIRDPQGRNVDPPGMNLTINANTEYTFQTSTTFQTPGTYTAWVTDLRNGVWDDTTYPSAEDGTVARKISFTVLPNPTITVQPTITTIDPRVGKSLSATFTVHNYGDQSVNVGSLAAVVRDPNGRNCDFSLQAATITSGGDFVYTSTNPGTIFQTPGTYTAWVADLQNGKWDDTTFPAMDNASLHRQITFTVKPSPTLTQGPTLSIPSPHVGQAVNASFTAHNYGDQAFNGGKIGMAIYGPQGQNVGLALQDLTVNAASDFSYQQSTTFTAAGTYTAWVTYTPNNGLNWSSAYPPAEDGTVVSKITFTVQP